MQLFLRLGKRMVLTPPGERVLGAARRVLDEIGRTEDDLRLMSQHGKGVLRLCTQCNTGYHWLPPLLQSFHRKFPGVDVQIMVNATDRPIEALLEGQIDLAIVTSEVDDKRLVDARRCSRTSSSRSCAPSHPFAKRAFIEPDDFAEEHLIVYKVERRDSYIFSRVLGPGRRRAGARVAGAADRSDPRTGQGGAGRQRDGALGDRAGDQDGRRARGAHHAPRRVYARGPPSRCAIASSRSGRRKFVALLSRQALPAKMDRTR